jgi:predicted butyrate kinase (DUF1464 family)
MYRYDANRVIAENAARIESYTYTEETGNIEVIYSVGSVDSNGVYTPLERKQITLEKNLHASVVKTMTDSILREIFTMLNSTGKIPAGAPVARASVPPAGGGGGRPT